MIDIKKFKENPQIFFKQLNEDEEREFFDLLEYFIYKHNIKFDKEATKKYVVADILPNQVNEFNPLSRDEIYAR